MSFLCWEFEPTIIWDETQMFKKCGLCYILYLTCLQIRSKREIIFFKNLPAAVHSHHLWDDMLECNTLPHEQTPTQPREKRQSPGPPADPEGRRLKKEKELHKDKEKSLLLA